MYANTYLKEGQEQMWHAQPEI